MPEYGGGVSPARVGGAGTISPVTSAGSARNAVCAGKTGKVVWMKEPYGEGLATPPAPSHAWLTAAISDEDAHAEDFALRH